MSKKRFPYGKCRKCDGAIAIPGLEAYKCDRCGWVKSQSDIRLSQNKGFRD